MKKESKSISLQELKKMMEAREQFRKALSDVEWTNPFTGLPIKNKNKSK